MKLKELIENATSAVCKETNEVVNVKLNKGFYPYAKKYVCVDTVGCLVFSSNTIKGLKKYFRF